MENLEVSYTEKSFPDKRVWDIIASQEQLVGKFTLLLGEKNGGVEKVKVLKWQSAILFLRTFCLLREIRKNNEYLPEKSLREVEQENV